MFIRKIGKFIRGYPSGTAIYSATIIGFCLGMGPAFAQGPAIYLILLSLLVILNANLLLAGLCLVGAQILQWLLLPVLYPLGVWLLHGPLEGLAASIVNAPVGAWSGVDYYVVLPGLLIGLLLGFLKGWSVLRILRGLRAKISTMETGSERYQKYAGKIYVKVTAWILLGGMPKANDPKANKKPLPVRPLGLALVVLLFVFLWLVSKFFDPSILTPYVRDGLARANGATVDLESMEWQPASNRMVFHGIAFADPADLQQDRLRSEQIGVQVSTSDLLRKRFVLEEIVVAEPLIQSPRKIPGKLVGPQPKEPPPENAGEGVWNLPGLMEDAQVWRERLAQIQKIYQRLQPMLKKDPVEQTEGEGAPPPPTWKEQLKSRADLLGYANVKAEHLIRSEPQIVIRKFEMLQLRRAGDSKSYYDVVGSELSSAPALHANPGKLQVLRNDGNMSLEVSTTPAETSDGEADFSTGLDVVFKNIPVADIAKQLKDPDKFPLSGGSLSFNGSGSIDQGILNLPLQVNVTDTNVAVGGQNVKISELPLQASLVGNLGSPALKIDPKSWEAALKAAAGGQLKGLLEDKLQDKLGGSEEAKGLLDRLPFGK